MFVDGIDNLVGAYKRSALNYFDDGSIEFACPPIKAILHIMAHGHYEGKTLKDAEVRDLFDREALLASDWYKKRLDVKQGRDVKLWERHVKSLEDFMAKPGHQNVSETLKLSERLSSSKAELSKVCSPEYLNSLVGTIGADPID
jgi:hypothetical protein